MAHPDLNQLLNSLIPFAQQMLAKQGEFYPFGSCIRTDGTIVANSVYDGNDHPSSQEIINLMTEAFHKGALHGEIQAAGICYDVRIIPPGQMEKTDAICISLEHQSGEAIDVFIPYKKYGRGKVDYGDLFAAPRTPQFFNK